MAVLSQFNNPMTFTTDMKINKVEGSGDHLISVNLFLCGIGRGEVNFAPFE